MTETPIQKLIAKFEDLKSKAPNLRDAIYLDGVLAVLDSGLAYEQEFINNLKNPSNENEQK